MFIKVIMSMDFWHFKERFFELLGNDKSKNFKLLVYDDLSFPLISQFRVRDLREHMVCDHIHIEAVKEELLGITVVYIVE